MRSVHIITVSHINTRFIMFFKKSAKDQAPQGKKAVFWGASDRMICCKGIAGEGNEFNVTSHPKLHDGGYVATLEITAPNEDLGLFIHAFYSGHWSFAVSPSNEMTDEMPNWSITHEWGSVNEHSETLNIYCPSGSEVHVIDRIENNG